MWAPKNCTLSTHALITNGSCGYTRVVYYDPDTLYAVFRWRKKNEFFMIDGTINFQTSTPIFIPNAWHKDYGEFTSYYPQRNSYTATKSTETFKYNMQQMLALSIPEKNIWKQGRLSW